MSHELIFFGGFTFFIILMLALDLGIFHKQDKPVSFSQAAVMSAVWVSFAICFYFFLKTEGQELHNIQTQTQLEQIVKSHQHQISVNSTNFQENLNRYKENLSLEFITGYIIEYALSVDNIFVMVLIFAAFGVKEKYYHRVLFWGILGAIIMRYIFIFLGATLVNQFSWILYVFGAFLIYSGGMMFFTNDNEEIDAENHKVVKLASKYFAVYPRFVGKKFFVKENGRRFITPLFLVLLIIEFTDVIFAVDSIPAIFSITKDPFIVFFSNIFAVLGLRSMFFLLVNVIQKFHYLQTGLAVLLVFIGVKMLVHHWLTLWGFTTIHSLFVIVGILTVSVVASLIFPKKETA
ncbi:MAG: TerC family protein [Bacteroidetes bacterium]|nr:TerC family protein [Bacteroidota bacterium]MBU1485447.1 TerC family protein [Bacteroidota bacterium]MBU2046209.1 TerC family protein [Bacteroidota bacterium]MBU2267225.1 TerC family protein [Bacteroidota bacterium]MBU2377264.1 TerC family protein [Bacteroidota bacterium]